ncbi:MAG: endonuclease NucS [Nanoarchaeota archaeon]
MDFSSFREHFDEAMKKAQMIVFFCECTIQYSGRAEAFLDKGDRLILIKQDKTMQVHQPEGSTPVNYMKAGAEIRLEHQNKHYTLKAFHPADKDYLDIEIYKVYDCLMRKLEDGQKLELVGTERDMSDWIMQNPTSIGKDFKPLSREEHTKFGFIDVFGHDREGNLVIVECKRYTANLDAVTQLRRYVEKIIELKGVKRVKGILASPAISPNAETMLKKWGYTWVHVHPPKRLERHNKKQRSIMDFD